MAALPLIPPYICKTFQVEYQVQGSAILLKIAGKLNEDGDFGPVLNTLADVQKPYSMVLFDLAGVREMNSCGIREWLLFLERVRAKSQVQYVTLPEIFVAQASVVSNLLGKPGFKVLAFELPYYCVSCKSRQSKLVKTEDLLKSDGKTSIPDHKCQKCSQALEFDAVPEDYFAFLKMVAR